MTTEQVYDTINDELLPVLKRFQQHGVAQISNDHKLKLQKVYDVMLPGTRLNLTCDSCLLHALLMCESWYERNTLNVSASTPSETITAATPGQTTATKVTEGRMEPAKKRATAKKKTTTKSKRN